MARRETFYRRTQAPRPSGFRQECKNYCDEGDGLVNRKQKPRESCLGKIR